MPDTGWRRTLMHALAKVIPAQDPDFLDLRVTVAFWWVELNDELVATREIGFGAQGELLRCAPMLKNMGVFIGEELNPAHLTDWVKKEEFETVWQQCIARFGGSQ